uniref:Uncharacterized protein n=1 Tax=Timema monikensis TaxID=170555 RepID=A0A7R9E5F0_9NEOP|nr:unnamed protein product [Timema monikensis]
MPSESRGRRGEKKGKVEWKGGDRTVRGRITDTQELVESAGIVQVVEMITREGGGHGTSAPEIESNRAEEVEVRSPRFTGQGWLAFPALRAAYKHVQLEVEFRPETWDGVLILTGERDDMTGDFMALLLHQGFVELRYIPLIVRSTGLECYSVSVDNYCSRVLQCIS